MSAVLALHRPVTRDEVGLAWATLRALVLAEANDPKLADDLSHQAAVAKARANFHKLYAEWVAQ